ncbi:hypothetical protein AB0M68_19680 [Streptomyces sp. NPDC051453]|uniref:hypothetical protein n=1 Tax=Streptomyces sp. NPDC051453 TaxID=3154941 RepID=UPI003421B58E
MSMSRGLARTCGIRAVQSAPGWGSLPRHRRARQGFIVGLAYTANANWAKNILAAGSGQITPSSATSGPSPQTRG